VLLKANAAAGPAEHEPLTISEELPSGGPIHAPELHDRLSRDCSSVPGTCLASCSCMACRGGGCYLALVIDDYRPRPVLQC